MNIKKQIKKSKFILACVYLFFYAVYTTYAAIYYARYKTTLGVLLIVCISTALLLTVFTTILSYRVNLLEEKPLSFQYLIKIAKYTAQLLASLTTVAMVFSAVQNTNAFSIIFAIASIPVLLFGILINVIANGIEKLLKKFGKKHFIPQPLLDSEGNEILLEDIDLKQEENSPAFKYFSKEKNTKVS